MRCRACGYVTLERRDSCTRCGSPLPGAAGAPRPAAVALPPEPRGGEDEDLRSLRLELGAPAPPPSPAPARARRSRSARRAPARPAPVEDEALELGEDELDDLCPAPEPVPAHNHPGADFRLDDDLLAPSDEGPGRLPHMAAAAFEDWGAAAVEREPRPLFSLDPPGGDEPEEGDAGPVIESDEEVPERFWAPEGARLARRAAALAVDLALQGGALALFYGGAFVALRLSGVPAGRLLSPAGLDAAWAPLALLGLLSSLVFDVACHAGAGHTPGKRLLGLEVRSLAGGHPSPAAAFARWLGAVLGLACAGVGLGWALFDPRRRGWADLLSKTVVAERRAGGAAPPAAPGGDRRVDRR